MAPNKHANSIVRHLQFSDVRTTFSCDTSVHSIKQGNPANLKFELCYSLLTSNRLQRLNPLNVRICLGQPHVARFIGSSRSVIVKQCPTEEGLWESRIEFIGAVNLLDLFLGE